METDIQEYINQKKELQKSILEFIEHGPTIIIENPLTTYLDDPVLEQDKNEIKTTLYLLTNIANNHHRNPYFFEKIEQILLRIKDKITNNLSNIEIFEIFKNSKRLLLFLIKEKFVEFDEICYKRVGNNDHLKSQFQYYFYPEIKELIDDETREQVKSFAQEISDDNFGLFENKRKLGENDTKICQIIRDDLIDEFIQITEQDKMTLNETIEPSKFETNPLLIENKPTLIEYSAFYGSLKIFNYLSEKVELKPTLWIYSIHSQKDELVHFLQEKNIPFPNNSIQFCIDESIKCHHNELVNFFDKTTIYPQSVKYLNFVFFPNDLNNIDSFFYLCQNDNLKLVEILLQNEDLNTNINTKVNGNDEIYQLLIDHKKIRFVKGVFCGCKALKHLTIPEKIKTIGESSFKGCTSLVEINIPPTVNIIGREAFRDCTSLTQIEIPLEIDKISGSLFEGCTSLVQITIPPLVKTIDEYAFYRCSSLSDVTFQTKVLLTIGDSSFRKCASLKDFAIPSTVTRIEKEAFRGCTSLTDIAIPNSVKCISDYAFKECSSLSEVSIPSSVKEIGSYSFELCVSLVKFEIPNSITRIEKETFKGCSSLSTVIIPSSVNFIGKEAFKDCISLSDISIPSSVKQIEESSFKSCKSLPKVEIPDSVTKIENETFSECSALNQVSIPSSVTVIGKSAFNECTSLPEILIPNSVTEIGYYAFYKCTSLTSVKIPSSVKNIGSHAFGECSSLKQVSIPESLKNIGYDVFPENTKITKEN